MADCRVLHQPYFESILEVSNLYIIKPAENAVAHSGDLLELTMLVPGTEIREQKLTAHELNTVLAYCLPELLLTGIHKD